jgi:transcriptional regulator with XRE-family HTH domain
MNHPKDILKNARKSRELTIREIAKKLGCPVTTFNSWERGAAFPNAKNRRKIEEVLNIPADSLVDPELSGQSNPSILSDYETRPLMMHRKHWELAESLLKPFAAPDLSHLFSALITEANRKKS